MKNMSGGAEMAEMAARVKAQFANWTFEFQTSSTREESTRNQAALVRKTHC
jgi:hypothetical protein